MEIRIAKETCIGCGQCVADCPASCLSLKEGKAQFRESGCIGCGHCYAVCPVNAVEVPEYDCSDTGAYVDPSTLDSEQLLQVMKSRRTVRQFINRPVDLETLRKIADAGRYAPTAVNSQSISLTLLENSRDEAEKTAIRLFARPARLLKKLSKGKFSFTVTDQFFFKGAPVVIIVSANSQLDAGLACSYMELMAESMGLGVLYSGFFMAALKISPKLRRMIKAPKGTRPAACMILGYPSVKYHRIVPRKPANIRKI